MKNKMYLKPAILVISAAYTVMQAASVPIKEDEIPAGEVESKPSTWGNVWE